MCAQYMIQIKPSVLFPDFQISLPTDIDDINERKLPHKKTPVIVLSKDSRVMLTSMNFSLIPSWSKEPKGKFATHNPRVETIT